MDMMTTKNIFKGFVMPLNSIHMSRPLLSRMPFLGALAGVGLGLLRTYVTFIPISFKGTKWLDWENTSPPSKPYYGIPLTSIYSANYVENLLAIINRILSDSSHPSPYFNFIIEAVLHGGVSRTVGRGFVVERTTDMTKLEHLIAEYIENFETQSGCPEERQPEEVVASLIRVHDRSDAPISATFLDTPIGSKEGTRSRKTTSNAQILSAVTGLESGLESMGNKIVDAIKSSPAPSVPFISGVNWAPIIQGISNVVISSLGGTVSFPSTTQPNTPSVAPTTPASTQPSEVMVSQIKELIKAEMAPLVTKISSFESALTTLVQTQTELTKGLSDLAQTSNARFDRIASLMEAQIKANSTSSGGSSNGGGTSSAPASPALNGNIIKTSNGVKTRILEETAPAVVNQWQALHTANLERTENAIIESRGLGPLHHLTTEECIKNLGFNPMIPPPEKTQNDSSELSIIPEIEVLPPEKKEQDPMDKIVTADLEALILPDGTNQVYMASWYNGEKFNTFDISHIYFK
jgi:hypothetical protein